MTWDFTSRMDTLGTRMKELHDNSLTYTRTKDGVTTSVTIENFTPGQCEVEQYGEAGIPIITEKLQDFIFDASELASFSPPIAERGDRLIWGTKTFEALSIGDKVYRFTTSSRLRIRVHTKQII